METLKNIPNYQYSGQKIFEDARDFFEISGTDYVELYVGNAKQSAYFFCAALGFKLVAYSGLETGNKEWCSYVLEQDKIRLVLSTAYHPDHIITKHVAQHGDGVKVIALTVENAEDAYRQCIERGAKTYLEPSKTTDTNGFVIQSGIHTYGDTVHVFVERKAYNGVFLPGYEATETTFVEGGTGLKYIDHMVGNVELGQMKVWADFYSNIMGFTNLITFDDKDISTNYTALMSKVMSNGNGRIKFPINEPAAGLKKSQIEEYLDFYHGPGCQHIAVATDDIVFTISEMRKRGIQFLHVPGEYYDNVRQRVGEIDEDLEILKSLGIMVDRDEEGYLLQIFTKPLNDRPTLFFEIIQRKGAKSFGKGNFKALFESIEAEQEKRGTL